MIMCRALSYEENTLDKSRLMIIFLKNPLVNGVKQIKRLHDGAAWFLYIGMSIRALQERFDLGGDIFRGQAVLLEQRVGLARLTEAILNANAAEASAGMTGQNLRDGGAETTGDEVLLGSDDGLHLAVIGENGLFIKGLDGVEIHDRRADTLGLKQLRRLNGAGHHESSGEDRGIAAVADDVGLAGDERRIRVGDGVGIRTGQAQIDGAVYLHGRRNGLLGLLGVTGDEHGHAGDAAHEAYILKRLMGAAVLADAESRVSERELDVCLGIGDAVADLLICAACAEHGEGAGEGDIAGEGEARRRVYHVCLGDAEIIEPVGKSLFEGAGLCGAGEIRVHNDYALIGFAKLCKSFAVCFSCGFSHLTQPPILSWPPRSRRSL